MNDIRRLLPPEQFQFEPGAPDACQKCTFAHQGRPETATEKALTREEVLAPRPHGKGNRGASKLNVACHVFEHCPSVFGLRAILEKALPDHKLGMQTLNRYAKWYFETMLKGMPLGCNSSSGVVLKSHVPKSNALPLVVNQKGEADKLAKHQNVYPGFPKLQGLAQRV